MRCIKVHKLSVSIYHKCNISQLNNVWSCTQLNNVWRNSSDSMLVMLMKQIAKCLYYDFLGVKLSTQCDTQHKSLRLTSTPSLCTVENYRNIQADFIYCIPCLVTLCRNLAMIEQFWQRSQ